jgi:pSer/pThr/pTyr-binding forkhead associated (FHA) protein
MPITCYLEIRSKDHLRQVPLESLTITLGRALENEIVLNDALVSRRHARLDYRDDQWVLTDLNSANGTFLNRQALSPQTPQPLASGDTFQIGSFELTIQLFGPSDPRPSRFVLQLSDPKEPVEKPIEGDTLTMDREAITNSVEDAAQGEDQGAEK